MTVIDQGTEQQLQWLQSIRVLAKQSGCEPEIIPRLQEWFAPHAAIATVTVIGAPNVGKSPLVNALLERPLMPVSPLPTPPQIAIIAAQGEEESLAGLSTLRGQELERIEIRIDNAWM